MSGLWNSIIGGESEAEVEWPEVNTIYYDKKKKYFTVSERDRAEKPIVYSDVHKIKINRTGLGLEFTPINFLSIYNIDTRKGLLPLNLGPVVESLVDFPFYDVPKFLVYGMSVGTFTLFEMWFVSY